MCKIYSFCLLKLVLLAVPAYGTCIMPKSITQASPGKIMNVYQLGGSLAQLLTNRSYSTPGPVSTGMGDPIGVQLPVRATHLSLTNHPGKLSLAILSCVGAMSTGQRAVMLCDWK